MQGNGQTHIVWDSQIEGIEVKRQFDTSDQYQQTQKIKTMQKNKVSETRTIIENHIRFFKVVDVQEGLESEDQGEIIYTCGENKLVSFKPKRPALEEQLAKYSVEERRFLIVDRINNQIIDTREEKDLDNFMKKPSIQTTKSSALKSQNFVSVTQDHKWRSSEGVGRSGIWDNHWRESQKMHEAFLCSICKADFQQFNKFLDKRLNPLPIQINYRSESNWCPIHYAAMHANPPIMSRLINYPKVDVNLLTDFGSTPLHIAVQSNKYDNCQLLIMAGVCIDYRDNDNETALHYAAQLGYKSIIQLLLKNGASEWIRNKRGSIPRDLCRTQDLLKLFTPPQKVIEEPESQSFYRLKRNAFVERMLTKSLIQNSNITMPPVSTEEDPSPFYKDPKKKNKQTYEGKKPRDAEKKVKTAKENRKKNYFRIYQLVINKKSDPVTLSSFKFYKKIGEGAFGEVYVVKKGKSDRLYALKAIKKQRVIGTALYRYIQTEKEVLSHISHPFIVKLHYAFQTEAYLFLVMDYCEGGDMSRLLEKKQRLEEKIVRQYAAEILLGLEALHQNMIIYRDLKPQNIVLDKDGHACITDFGLSKKTNDLNAINKSFCGTPAYLPLEIINKKGHTRMADWYEFGIVLYELMTGIPPFYADTKTQLYEKVKAGVIRFPKHSSETFRDLIKKLLAQNPQKRLGFEKDAQSIKEHEWFQDVDWGEVYQRQQKMPPVDNKIKIPCEPIKTKFADIKSQKYFIPSWSFVI